MSEWDLNSSLSGCRQIPQSEFGQEDRIKFWKAFHDLLRGLSYIIHILERYQRALSNEMIS